VCSSDLGYEASLEGSTVGLLLPADTSTHYFSDYCMQAKEIIFLQPRVIHLHPNGRKMHGSPKFGSMFVVFESRTDDVIRPAMRSMRWKERVKKVC
jgi:hypothetical protein